MVWLQCDPEAASPQAVLPGDEVLRLPEAGVVRVGMGLQQSGGALVTNRAGVLRQTKGGKLWVEGSQKRHVPLCHPICCTRAWPDGQTTGRLLQQLAIVHTCVQPSRPSTDASAQLAAPSRTLQLTVPAKPLKRDFSAHAWVPGEHLSVSRHR